MDETMMNVENEDVVQPQSGEYEETAAPQSSDNGEAAAPQAVDVDAMTDDEFAEYIKSAQNGTIDRQPAQEQPEQVEEEPDNKGVAEPEAKPFKQFMTQEEYQGEIDRIVSKRYNDVVKKNKQSLDLFDRLKLQARNFYGDAADDTAAVEALIGDLTSQNADRRGVETEEYNRQTQDAEDARRWREQQAAASEQEQRQNAQRERLERDIEDVRRIVPAFDFNKAMQNETFRKAIMDGASVQTAYMIANQPKAQKPKRQPIKQVGMQSGVSGRTDYDPSKLPPDEFRAYIQRQMNR